MLARRGVAVWNARVKQGLVTATAQMIFVGLRPTHEPSWQRVVGGSSDGNVLGRPERVPEMARRSGRLARGRTDHLVHDEAAEVDALAAGFWCAHRWRAVGRISPD